MSLPDTIQTLTYYIAQISAMKPAYVQLVRYVPGMDPTGKDGVKRGTLHDVLKTYGPIIKPLPESLREHNEAAYRGSAMPKFEFDAKNPTPTRLFVNGGLSPEEAEGFITKGILDAAVFGKLWIGNPYLQKRIERGVPVNRDMDRKTFYVVPESSNLSLGYTTYPEAK